MNSPTHPFSELFLQLGLPAGEVDIQQFLASHTPLAADVLLPNAPFWTPTQSALLREEALKDADWAAVIDQLNLALRAKRE
ncbi:DUF2789 domain-containing protein [Rhodoferax sp. PAMC 29310]|uniref:DUF2789 domain-containing protein n=1 Tax=Rhodoferax sp. PAMC 29310 TaxID=2822760 RepID=UPI001B3210B7|nr:DUF2789 domain-containing protein [Rhodoferax sp. PAMC 29310]